MYMGFVKLGKLKYTQLTTFCWG